MHPLLDDASAARLPATALPLLAPLRTERGLEVAPAGDAVWLRWPAGRDAVARAVLPLAGAELFVRRDDTWHRVGRALPAFDVPADLDYRPLAHVLFPAPLEPLPPPTLTPSPLRLTLRRDSRPRPTSAICVSLAALCAWADGVPSMRLAELHGVFLGSAALLVGDLLPPLADGVRYWGHDVLVPLGYAPWPDLPESALVRLANLPPQTLLLLDADRVEVVPRERLTPLSRAGLRLAAMEGPHVA